MREAWPEDPTIWFGDEFEPLVTLHLPREPVSQGADARKRRGLITDLQRLTTQVPWMYTGDVSVVIEWTVHVRWRYESDRAADVDNIVKPLLDGISGPDGVLIDDTQVNHVAVNWTTWARADRQHLKIDVRSLDQGLYQQKGFPLVEMRPPLCLPMPTLSGDPEARRILCSLVQTQFDGYDELQARGVPWEVAGSILPIQRPFHRNKLRGFEVLAPEQYVQGVTLGGQDL